MQPSILVLFAQAGHGGSVDFTMGGVFAALGTLAFFGGIALLMWIDQRGKSAQRQLEHAERLRALELGQELPDAEVARAEAIGNRAWAASLVGWFVPLLAIGSAVGGTALVFAMASAEIHLPLVCTIWGVCGLISLSAVRSSLATMRAIKQDPVPVKPSADGMGLKTERVEGIVERN